MTILVDTNVLLRTARPDDPDHQVALASLAMLRESGHLLAIVPQCLYEYFVVATRPIQQNGLGLDSTEGISAVNQLLDLFRLYRDERGVFDAWKGLIAVHAVRGKPAHDARLVAAMSRHRISHLLTFNSADFRRYEPLISLVDPRSLTTAT
ncbi:type II toxin-antitoxin system VapC family toxin [Planctomicrobium piriforme]|uniref:Predicted nucleic acid-binding protein, contains PIN domain n=1 Tax=Planctomicrobium piriforme TaxID=1576369 RepID=A0A1I3AVI7_9PLAN|nr:PIN domain-containing protein [Planctomicrobium piriforme]SFH54087.1 Predicted nucleic acid-binding protein, contains PIN domain [Planctomicrobium piriforme]